MTQLRTLIASAYHTAKQGYYHDALDEFRLILNHDPGQKEALYGAAACAFRLNRTDLAEDFIDRLLENFPNDAQALELRERIDASGFAQAEEKSKDIVQRLREQTEDPFGVGADKKLTEVIPEWRTLDVRPPSFMDLMEYGKTVRPGELRIFAAYGEAWRLYRSNFKRLVWAGWFSLFVQIGFLACALSLFSGWLVSLETRGPILRSLTELIANVIAFAFYPLLAVHTQFCYRWKRNPKLGAMDQLRFVEKYPYLLIGLPWLLGPGILLWAFLQVGALGLPRSAEAFLPPKTANDAIVLLILLTQIYVFLRAWFIHIVIEDEDLRPLAAVSKAYYLTRQQRTKTFLFVLIQTLLFPLAALPLGIGYPFLCLAQVTAFDQLNRTEASEGGAMGAGG
jgi:hypothetical protein